MKNEKVICVELEKKYFPFLFSKWNEFPFECLKNYDMTDSDILSVKSVEKNPEYSIQGIIKIIDKKNGVIGLDDIYFNGSSEAYKIFNKNIFNTDIDKLTEECVKNLCLKN